jgi:hypothetical protein
MTSKKMHSKSLKKALMTAQAPGLWVQDKFLYVQEKGGLALGVVTQLRGITPHPVGYLSKELDQVAKEWSGCLQAVTAVSLLVPKAQKLVLNRPLTDCTTHDLRRNFKLEREVTLIVLGITTMIAALAKISYAMVANHVTAKNLTKVVEGTSDQVGLDIKNIQRSLSSLACMVMDIN